MNQIANTSEVNISETAQLLLSMELWKQTYKKLCEQIELAWKVYDDAIEANEPYTEIDRLGRMAQSFEDVKSVAWRNWQEKKHEYLSKLN